MKLLTSVSIVMIGLLLFTQPVTAANWKLAKTGHGVDVYTKKVKGQKMRDFKGETTIEAQLRDIASLFNADYAYKEWLADIVESRRVSKVSDVDQYIYLIQKMPVIKDRDVVVHGHMTQNPVTKELTVTVKEQSGMVDESKKYVRIPRIHGRFSFTPMEGTTLKVVYEMSIDPGGSIPPFIANKVAINTPYKTLLNLKKISKSLKQYEDPTIVNPFVNAK